MTVIVLGPRGWSAQRRVQRLFLLGPQYVWVNDRRMYLSSPFPGYRWLPNNASCYSIRPD